MRPTRTNGVSLDLSIQVKDELGLVGVEISRVARVVAGVVPRSRACTRCIELRTASGNLRNRGRAGGAPLICQPRERSCMFREPRSRKGVPGGGKLPGASESSASLPLHYGPGCRHRATNRPVFVPCDLGAPRPARHPVQRALQSRWWKGGPRSSGRGGGLAHPHATNWSRSVAFSDQPNETS
jgi:hypothetical protein